MEQVETNVGVEWTLKSGRKICQVDIHKEDEEFTCTIYATPLGVAVVGLHKAVIMPYEDSDAVLITSVNATPQDLSNFNLFLEGIQRKTFGENAGAEASEVLDAEFETNKSFYSDLWQQGDEGDV